MTDSLEERVAELEARVRQLERVVGQDDESPTASKRSGVDHRDAAVLEHVRENGDPGPRGTVQLYQTLTDITQRKTAKRRAEQLRKRDAFKTAVGK